MTTPIALVDLQALAQSQRDELLAAAQRVLESGWYVLGKEVEAFEAAFAAFIGSGQAVSVANGTDAVELSLRAVGIRAGDHVATVSHTAVATVAAIERLGAIPVLVDIDPHRYTLCPDSLAAAMAAYPIRAVVAVHLYGQCADMPRILDVAGDVPVIEDCAQATGARLNGCVAGTMAAAGSFSFYPTKNLGAFGDGGAVVTTDTNCAARLRRLRQYGWQERYDSVEVGVNSRLDELQAALLSVRLTRLAQENRRRQELAALYDRELAEVADIYTPSVAAGAEHVYHLYVIRSANRDGLMQRLKAAGIGSALHYPLAVHQQQAYAGRLPFAPTGLPQTEAAVREILSLPLHPMLSDEDVLRVCRVLKG